MQKLGVDIRQDTGLIATGNPDVGFYNVTGSLKCAFLFGNGNVRFRVIRLIMRI